MGGELAVARISKNIEGNQFFANIVVEIIVKNVLFSHICRGPRADSEAMVPCFLLLLLESCSVFSFLVFTKSEKTFPRTHRGPAAILKIFFATHRFSLAH